jgi:hypothetical protein
MVRCALRAAPWIAAAAWTVGAFAAVENNVPNRFDRLAIQDPSSRLGVVAEAPERVPGLEALRDGWSAFRRAHGASWRVWVDRRSGTPILAEGAGIPWFSADQAITADQLEQKARGLLAGHGAALGVAGSELVWNKQASGATEPGRWVLSFDRVVAGIPVEGEHFVLYVNRGRLVSFGATRWGAIATTPGAVYGEPTARELLYAYMGLSARDRVEEIDPPRQVFVAAPPAQGDAGAYAGPVGQGVTHLLVWRFVLRVEGDSGTWVGKVDARSGKVVALYDDTMYAGVKGGVYPISNDLNCADFGCEAAGYPFPYAAVTIAKKAVATGDMGLFACPRNGNRNSSVGLSGPYVRVQDSCGLASVSGNCAADLDFGAGPGTDCTVPSGLSAGDTHAGRVTYYHLNRVKEKARYWLPANGWVNQQLVSKTNTFGSCNAFWNGSVNFYRSGGGCRNAGEIAGVVTHEYGHGLDQNDGGGYDNPSEAYADVIAILQERRSCVGRGFFQNGTCSGYGDTCLTCSGIRDMDWAARTRQTAATPANFTLTSCGGGSGPCGRAVHCESYVPSEAIFDLATRDLVAAGLDADSAWQLAEKLFYKSRQGSGGNAFNCALPSSDGCGAGTWFTKLRNADDDDGNLANGTPHAAAIFAAFDRHAIACGAAADASNQSTSSCPGLTAPSVSAIPGANQVSLSWAPVPGAARYLVLRSDVGCGYSANVVATVTGTSFVDDQLPSGFPLSYKVQAQGSNTACDGPVSACVPASAQ